MAQVGQHPFRHGCWRGWTRQFSPGAASPIDGHQAAQPIVAHAASPVSPSSTRCQMPSFFSAQETFARTGHRAAAVPEQRPASFPVARTDLQGRFAR